MYNLELSPCFSLLNELEKKNETITFNYELNVSLLHININNKI